MKFALSAVCGRDESSASAPRKICGRASDGSGRRCSTGWSPISQVRICLDLFAGSGALGFEALSRGAASAVLVEKDRRVAQSLRENCQLLAADNASVVNAPAERFLRQPPAEPWDIVFFDPPFSDPEPLKLLETLQQEGYLTDGGLIYIEQPRHRPLPDGMRLLKQAKAGDCHFALLRGG